MKFADILLMRHELVLLVITLVILGAEVFSSGNNKRVVSIFTIILFALHTTLGFLPLAEGSLFGGMYNTSHLIVTMKNILNIGVLIILIQSVKWIQKPENNYNTHEFYVLLFSTLLGMNFMISAGNFLMFYIGLETATIPMATLAAFNKDNNKSAEAGVKLILSSALSSGILLFGLSMMYAVCGTLYFDQLATLVSSSPLFTLAFIFFFAGMSFKISLVPFHLWTADVYEGSPINVTSYLSVISKGAAAFIFTIVLFSVFKNIFPLWRDMIYVIAIATITVGNLFALRQTNMKRFLAFSSIAQAGFILLGIIAGTAMGMATVIYFVLVYIFSNLAAFGVVSAISDYTGKEDMSDYDGLYKTNPNQALVLMLAMFSLAGIPPVAGFFGKFFLFTAAAEANQTMYYILVLIALINTIISLYYYLMPVKAMFINKNENPLAKFKSDFFTRTGLVICVIGLFVTGFISNVFEDILKFCFGI